MYLSDTVKIFRPQLEKTYQLTRAPGKDSDQPSHPRSLI